MPRDHAFWEKEINDDLCMSCGTPHYKPSRVAGICQACALGLDGGEDDDAPR